MTNVDSEQEQDLAFCAYCERYMPAPLTGFRCVDCNERYKPGRFQWLVIAAKCPTCKLMRVGDKKRRWSWLPFFHIRVCEKDGTRLY